MEQLDQDVEVIRHSTAHLLAHAVKRLYPKAQVTIGPVIEHGFYYDFAYDPGFHEEDLVRIEEMMRQIIKEALPIERQAMTRDEALAYFKGLGEHYKVEIIESIPADETLNIYVQGDFADLCRGPHVSNTKVLGAFALTKLAGAYWRGDSNRDMLSRIYGVAFQNPKALRSHLAFLEEAKKRDHRRLSKLMHLFHIEEASPGMVFWHPQGWTMYQEIQSYLRAVLRAEGYREVNTPVMASRHLWEASGHWEKFHAHMFLSESEGREYAVKPMNCPCHVQIFKQGLKSYRDLPWRLSEFGSCHRNEPSGTLQGLMRVRAFTQDDAHIFCTQEQLSEEVSQFIALLYRVYADFGFSAVLVKLSTRPEVRVGDDATWNKAEDALSRALEQAGIAFEYQPGEGAFYGPKIEFSLKDCLGRVWQCGTIQVDFFMPERLGASYVASDGEKLVPVMLHRAILGSLERFMGILIEHYAGVLPLWLAPTQVVICNITDAQKDFVEHVVQKASAQGLRVVADRRNEKINLKVREHTLACVPYIWVVGEREQSSNAVAIREKSGKQCGVLEVDVAINLLVEAVVTKRHRLFKEETND